ncbi:exodeoxyribonuclease III [Marinilongibacter aquaticus]|uniref:exodeoxyribonuclease III n=1 Tax=Marinilongibacter aquaticus TaxID=2975157 RepID=UPI0021BDE928|nr:exodeoxyribonuclease III [Marinilongibacter aquaticus]UBM57497.1 exodeoxyribonuclease III [Marinilongibacter aquaticus]
MQLYSFNVNGIRAAIKKGLLEWIDEVQPEILCLQEIKLSETELVEPHFLEMGYHCYWYPAEKKGYSGVAILSKIEPKNVEYGIKKELFDQEGRVLIADYEQFTLICAYFPSGTTGDIRQDIKMQFLDEIFDFMSELKKEKKEVLLCGDVNICHEAIDIHNPVSNKNSSGFLPEERAWVSKFLDAGYIDTFRHFNKDPHHYSWWSYRAGARGKNKGWRIDYFFSSNEMKEKLLHASIHPEVIMSDHCPVSLVIKD